MKDVILKLLELYEKLLTTYKDKEMAKEVKDLIIASIDNIPTKTIIHPLNPPSIPYPVPSEPWPIPWRPYRVWFSDDADYIFANILSNCKQKGYAI